MAKVEIASMIQEALARLVEPPLLQLEQQVARVKEHLLGELSSVQSQLGPSARTGAYEEMVQTISDLAWQQAEQQAEQRVKQTEACLEDRFLSLVQSGQKILGGTSQSEILAALLEAADRFAGRIILFLSRGDNLVGWKGAGSALPADASLVAGLQFEKREDGNAISEAFCRQVAVQKDFASAGLSFLPSAEGRDPESLIAVPLMVAGKSTAVLYADSHRTDPYPFQPQAILFLASLAQIRIELITFSRTMQKVGLTISPVAESLPVKAIPVAAPPVPEARPACPPEPEPAPSQPEPPPEPAEVPSPVPEPEREAEPAPVPEPEPLPFAGIAAPEPPSQEPPEPPQPPADDWPAAEEAAPEIICAAEEPPVAVEIEPVFVAAVEEEAAAPEEQAEIPIAPVVPDLEETLHIPISQISPGSQDQIQEVEEPVAVPEEAVAVEVIEAPPEEEPKVIPSPAAKQEEKERVSSFSFTPEDMQTGQFKMSMMDLLSQNKPSAPSAPAEPAVPPAPEPVPSTPEESVTSFIAGLQGAAAGPSTAPAAPKQESSVERLHSDARRFARLLVSEIKLYNEAALLESRKSGNIYLRLKKAIDLSREHYTKRIVQSGTPGVDCFHEELVRMLCDGNASLLGKEYPGPVE